MVFNDLEDLQKQIQFINHMIHNTSIFGSISSEDLLKITKKQLLENQKRNTDWNNVEIKKYKDGQYYYSIKEEVNYEK